MTKAYARSKANKSSRSMKSDSQERFRNGSSSNFCPGEIVEVCSDSEIRRTLDEDDSLEGLQFTPEMRKYCGKRFEILKHVSKTVVEGVGMRHINDAVVLKGVTCGGEYHGRCQRTCQLLWKKAWLKNLKNDFNLKSSERRSTRAEDSFVSSSSNNSKDEVFSCQSTNLIKATSPSIWDIRQQILDVSLRARGTVRGRFLAFLYTLLSSLDFKIRSFSRLNRHLVLHGNLRRTPTASLWLKPGELVEIKRKEDILATLDLRGRNRGLPFTLEMLEYCGGKYRVLKRVEKMINETTGQMRQILNTVILEEVTCDGKAHGDCERTCPCLWREIWLNRTD